jgi:type 1 fimbria pilin
MYTVVIMGQDELKMKKNKSLILMMFLFISHYAVSATCEPQNGTVNAQYSLGQQNITDIDNNITGYVYPSQTVTAPDANITMICDCPDTANYNYFWLWVDTTLPFAQTVGNFNYYNIPGNDYLQIGMIINSPEGNKTVPFGPVHNSAYSYRCDGSSVIATGGTHTGSILTASFRIRKPFIGTSVINNVLIASSYWNIGNVADTSHSPIPSTNLYLNGTITVPQNCTVNAGTEVVVDLGSIYTGDLKNIGQKPDNYTPKSFNVPIKCNDISAAANLTLRIQGTSSTGFSDALQSDNTDVGVVITNSHGDIMRPNDSSSLIPFTLDSNSSANITLQAYPVSTTGNTPAEGLFTTLAYLRVDFS